MNVLLVDHQDSFTWNLAHALGACTGALPEVVESGAIDAARVAAAPPDLLVLGPGPGHPANARDAARSLDLLAALPATTPLFGVCFGLQLIVTSMGGAVVRARAPVHGKSSRVLHDGSGLFEGLRSPASMMRYHSLVAERSTLPRELRVVAESPEGEVMALVHASRPLWAVQFHPESVGSPLGARLIENVVALAGRARVERVESALVCAVLAAGRSSRMGAPKALVELAGERALERILRIARASGLRRLVVLGFHEREVRAAVDFGDAAVVVNPAPERGQSSSVRLAAQQLAPGESLLLWPVDHARVQEATVARLLAAFRERAPNIELVVPSHRGRRGHPLIAGPAAARELAALRDDEPAHVVVRRDPVRVRHVTVDDPMVVADFDRPQDLGAGESLPARPRDPESAS